MDFEIISIHKHGDDKCKRIRYVNDDRYMNTSIYKIQCKDETVEDMYIGHTTNFEKRKMCHMIETETSITKVYKFYIMRDMKKHADFTSYINDMELLCRIGPPICDSTA